MLTFSTVVKYLSIRLFFLSISGLSLEPTGKRKASWRDDHDERNICLVATGADSPYFQTEEHYCPFVETLSFGSDITVKCNDSHLIFSEINVSRRERPWSCWSTTHRSRPSQRIGNLPIHQRPAFAKKNNTQLWTDAMSLGSDRNIWQFLWYVRSRAFTDPIYHLGCSRLEIVKLWSCLCLLSNQCELTRRSSPGFSFVIFPV